MRDNNPIVLQINATKMTNTWKGIFFIQAYNAKKNRDIKRNQ